MFEVDNTKPICQGRLFLDEEVLFKKQHFLFYHYMHCISLKKMLKF